MLSSRALVLFYVCSHERKRNRALLTTEKKRFNVRVEIIYTKIIDNNDAMEKNYRRKILYIMKIIKINCRARGREEAGESNVYVHSNMTLNS